ncbi:unnamed protein product [Phaeothamnion confervicola]
MATQTKAALDHPSFIGHWGPNPTTERGNNLHLGVHPKEPKIVYPSGKFIVVRDLENPANCFVYRGHNNKTTVAKFSPNGFWVASADIAGKVRIWSWENPEHVLKIEIQGLGGAIKDLAWDSESKRIVVAGDGTGMNMRAFAWDTGSNLGEMIGHNKRVNSCDYRPVRPFKIMTASEDMRTVFFKGPPFSLEHSNGDQHSNFVNCIRFSPDGSLAATCGSDYKVWLYDGKTGAPLRELAGGGGGHTGSVYSLSWTAGGAQLVTCSADKTCKLWDASPDGAASGGGCVHTWAISEEPGVVDMQCAVAAVHANAASISLDGTINVLLPGQAKPAVTIHAHQVAITAMCPTPLSSGAGGVLVTGSFDGVVVAWDAAAGLGRRAEGQLRSGGGGGCAAAVECNAVHGNKVAGIALCATGVVSVGWDDCLRLAPLPAAAGGAAGGPRLAYSSSLATTGQPCGVSAGPESDLVAVATATGVSLCRGASAVLCSLETSYTPASVALFGEEEVAVGGQDGKIRIYAISGGKLFETRTVEGHRGAVTALAYSPDGTHLAAGDAMRECNVWVRGTWEPLIQGLWQFHTTKINCLAWAPGGRVVATGGQDENIFVWSLDKPRRRIHYPFAHKDGVAGLAWLSEDVLASAGADHCVARWNIAADRSKLA